MKNAKQPQKTITVIQDSREQRPLPFTELDLLQVHLSRSKTPTLFTVETIVEKLDAGDYKFRINAVDTCFGVETKRSADELATNLLSGDYRRASTAFDRFELAYVPAILVCEFSQAELFNHPESKRLLDAFFHLTCQSNQFQVWFTGPRQAKRARLQTAELLLRWCVQHHFAQLKTATQDDD
jgi:hypothetical protein